MEILLLVIIIVIIAVIIDRDCQKEKKI